jgi:hypothetical protein
VSRCGVLGGVDVVAHAVDLAGRIESPEVALLVVEEFWFVWYYGEWRAAG